MTQTVVLRQSLSVFWGNELVIGIVLASWMILTACGSLAGRRASRAETGPALLTLLFTLLALLPVGTVFLLEALRNTVFPHGSMVGLWEILAASALLLLPYCFISGLLFTVCSHLLTSSQVRGGGIVRVYALEAAGGVAGGVIFNLILIVYLPASKVLCLLGLVNLTAAFGFALLSRRKPLAILPALAACALAVMMAGVDLDAIARARLFPGEEILFMEDTPYGNLTVTQQEEQRNFYENGVLLFSTGDLVQNEESVHFAMSQRPRAQSVLLISGGISGLTREVLKYGVRQVDYVELNPSLTAIGKNYTTSLEDPRIRVINQDARIFVRNTPVRYDAVLLNTPDPGTAQINRYYTVEFFEELKRTLAPDAVVSFAIQSSADYYGGEARQFGGVLLQTLRSVFRTVTVVPGTKDYFLASDSLLDVHVAERIALAGIATTYANKYYIDDELLAQRSARLLESLAGVTDVNRDFLPIAYYRQLQFWLQQFAINPWYLLVAAVALVAIVMARVNVVTYGIFWGGFVGSAAELLILIGFQVVYGYLYQMTGLIIALFMAGLALGAVVGSRLKTLLSRYGAVQIALALACASIPLLTALAESFASTAALVHLIFALMTLAVSCLLGMEFRLAALLQSGSAGAVAGELYGVDLIGGAVGAVMSALFLIPLLGLTTSSYLLFCLAATSGAGALLKARQKGAGG